MNVSIVTGVLITLNETVFELIETVFPQSVQVADAVFEIVWADAPGTLIQSAANNTMIKPAICREMDIVLERPERTGGKTGARPPALGQLITARNRMVRVLPATMLLSEPLAVVVGLS